MSLIRKLLQLALRVLLLPASLILFLIKQWLVVELVLPNVTLFGHLALEPEKILSKINSERSEDRSKPKRILIWSFDKPRLQANKTLVKMWRRELFVLPSAVVDALHRSSKWIPNFEINILQFDKLHENDHVLDNCASHLKFSKAQEDLGHRYLRRVGVMPGMPYVCLIVREAAWAPPTTGPSSSGTLRSRSFEDFVLAAEALIKLGVAVIKLGAPGTFKTSGTQIIDYANSGDKSEFLDVYLPAHATAAVSTMSGPDAVALASRVPVLYIDIAQYSLCFAGTELVTWVPALLHSQKLGRVMSLGEVFESGAGRFLGATPFDEAKINVIKSSPEKICEHVVSFYTNLSDRAPDKTSVLQADYQKKFYTLLSQNSVAPLGQFKSKLSEVFIADHGDVFLA
jgi:putative glycosyltransferase (TIGR04372 family)